MRNSVRRRAQHRFNRLTGIDNERGSMAILLMVVLVGMMLSAMIVPVIITQDRTTRFDTTRVQALNAAESGIDVTIGLIRSSVSATTSIGDSTKLPCGPLSGTVNTTGIAAYSVRIDYLTADPLQPVKAGDPSPLLLCDSRYGPYQQASSGNPGGTVTPKFARLTSTGTVGTAINGSTAGRTLTSTYKFKTADTNFLGGVIKINPPSASLCMDVGSATPAAGTAVMLQNCSTSNPPAPQQVFAYRTDLTLQLASTAPSNGVNGCDRGTPSNCGLCLDTAATPAAAGNAVKLDACGPLGSPASYTEQWSYNDGNPGQYQASNATSASTAPSQPGTRKNDNLPDLCMTIAGKSAGLPVVVASCTGGAQPWVPSPSVGAGAAALPQWINFNEFGRCLDVTAEDVNTTHLIDFPCKQNPYPGAVLWNQKFQVAQSSATPTYVGGQMSVTTPAGLRYCLTSPDTDGVAVTMTPCSTSTLQQWTIYNGDKSLPYSAKYQIMNGALCLGLAPPVGSEVWSSIVVENCTGATDQKWNANPSVLSSSQKDTKEK